MRYLIRYLAINPVTRPAPTAAMIRSGASANMLERFKLNTKYATMSCVRLCTTAPKTLKPIMLNRRPDTRCKMPILKELVKAAGKLKIIIGKAPKMPASKARIHATITAARVSYIIKATRVITFANPSLSHKGRGIGS